jgi:Large polyvalent protein associated domain 38
LPNPIPTSVLPLIENMANWSIFRGRPIVTRGKENLEPSEQYGSYTSETAKAIGKVVNYPPAKIENLIYGYTAGLGAMALSASDYLASLKAEAVLPAKSMADRVGIRAFVARSPGGSSESIEKFYTEYNRAQTARETLLSLQRERRFEKMRDYFKAHKPELAEYEKLNSIAEVLSALRKQSQTVRQSKEITPDEKKQRLDTLTFKMIDFARRGVKKDEATQ